MTPEFEYKFLLVLNGESESLPQYLDALVIYNGDARIPQLTTDVIRAWKFPSEEAAQLVADALPSSAGSFRVGVV
jgi:hypothetical protein